MDTRVSNPLLEPWDTPFGLPPFEWIAPEHYEPAFADAMQEHLAELRNISTSTAAPDFDNTIVAFEQSGRTLRRIELVFSNITASETSPELEAIERDMAPRLAAHENAVYLDPDLFARIDSVHATRDRLGLSDEARQLTERIHLDFVRAGARLSPAARARSRHRAQAGGAHDKVPAERARGRERVRALVAR